MQILKWMDLTGGENTMKSINCPDCDTKLLYIKGILACPICGRDGKEITKKQNLRLMAWFSIPIIIFTLIYFGIRMKLYEMQSLITQKLFIVIALSILGGLLFIPSIVTDLTTKRNAKVLLVFSILIFIAALFFLIKFLYLFFFTEWQPIRLF